MKKGRNASQSPRHWHSDVHTRPAFLHLHFLTHMGTDLQPHFMSYLQATAAAGTVVQMGYHPVSDLDLPNPSGLGAAMTGFRLSVQILAWNTHRLTCWSKAFCIGGSLSISYTLLGKSPCQRLLTLLYWVVFSYMAQVNFAITLNTGDYVSWGTNDEDDAVVNLSLMVGSYFQVFQADFFPLPLNWDVTSHPVKAWKKDRVWHLSSPSSRQTELMW